MKNKEVKNLTFPFDKTYGLGFFNKILSSKDVDSIICSPLLFDETNRGVIELDDVSPVETKKLGICDTENTPEDLIDYFENPIDPPQNWYAPDLESSVGRWFANYKLPIITGASGTARDCISKMGQIHAFDKEELRVVKTGLAAALVAQGHHSYFEIFIVLVPRGFPLEKTKTMFDFYAQTLPKSILESDDFKQFKASNAIAKTLMDTSFDGDEPCIEGLPSLSKTM